MNKKKFKLPKFIKIISIIFIIVLSILFYIWQKYALINTNYDIQKFHKKIQELKQEKKELIIKKTQLSSPKKIKKIATDKFNMQEMNDSDIVILEVER